MKISKLLSVCWITCCPCVMTSLPPIHAPSLNSSRRIVRSSAESCSLQSHHPPHSCACVTATIRVIWLRLLVRSVLDFRTKGLGFSLPSLGAHSSKFGNVATECMVDLFFDTHVEGWVLPV